MFEIDIDKLMAFESQLNIRKPEQSRAKILGYGEISTVFAIDDLPGYAFKRLSIFHDMAEVERYREVHEAYIEHLRAIDIEVVACSITVVNGKDGLPIVYIIQQQLESDTLVHKLVAAHNNDVFSIVLNALSDLWAFNATQSEVELGIDGQLSNWGYVDGKLLYIDTSTPFIRINGEEQLDQTLFLRPAPSFLRWILKALFLNDVVGRYYDFRAVVIDILGNLYKEQLPQLVPAFIETANKHFPDNPIMEKEVKGYYREDAFIWSLYLNARKLDRFLLRGKYRYILPGKIKR